MDNSCGVVVLILTAQGFGVFMRNGMRIFIDLAKNNTDTSKISGLDMQLAGSQAIFQVIIILIMAHLAMY